MYHFDDGTDTEQAAIITKYKAPDAEKPVIRPYTPINDEGMHHLSSHTRTRELRLSSG